MRQGTGAGFDAEWSVVHLQNIFYDRKSETGSYNSTFMRFVFLVVTIPNVGKVFLGDAGPRIDDRDTDDVVHLTAL